MAVKSIRFNNEEEKILKHLKEFYNCDTSNLIKKSLAELYENALDSEIVSEYENREKQSASNLLTIKELLS
ncbi:hypothetical protein MNBD_IGNAVI01-394 [hydrothermal vent metagenome]|uniref:Uncharacterized protein n=1 Tax=hydrothermal vent metagenome TaxID=652676 RepID=A0A3B1BUK2_9ZZZZ